MTDKFKNKYRIPSARWRKWDYGANGAYFVTICTAHRERFFGKIADGKMTLSEIGRTAHDYWTQIPEHFPFVVLDAFVIMPNHVHGIIVIDVQTPNAETPRLGVSALNTETKQWYPGTLGVIINQYKRACTMYARRNGIPFAWQTRFHDRVIRDNGEHHRIARYINANIENWQDDKLHG
jgi:REP element-mobilizing transposase RayT